MLDFAWYLVKAFLLHHNTTKDFKDSNSLNLKYSLKVPVLKGCPIAYGAVGRQWDL